MQKDCGDEDKRGDRHKQKNQHPLFARELGHSISESARTGYILGCPESVPLGRTLKRSFHSANKRSLSLRLRTTILIPHQRMIPMAAMTKKPIRQAPLG